MFGVSGFYETKGSGNFVRKSRLESSGCRVCGHAASLGAGALHKAASGSCFGVPGLFLRDLV